MTNPPRDGRDGKPGKDGRPGRDGLDGQPGPSPYDVAVQCGYQGSESDWLATLQGKQGAPGKDGKDGAVGVQGEKGEVGRQGIVGRQGPQGEIGPQGEPGSKGPKGDTGPAPDHEWEGTYLRFQRPNGRWGPFVNLKGKEGERGPKGDPGTPGGGLVRVIHEGGGTGSPGTGAARYTKNLSGLIVLINKTEHDLTYVNQITVVRQSDGAICEVAAKIVNENVTIESNVPLAGHMAILS